MFSYAPCPDSRARNGQSPTYCVAQMKDFFQTIDREYSSGNASMRHFNQTGNLGVPERMKIEECMWMELLYNSGSCNACITIQCLHGGEHCETDVSYNSLVSQLLQENFGRKNIKKLHYVQ